MTAITNISDLVNRLSGGNNGSPETIFFWKDPRVDGAVAQTPSSVPVSLWKYEGIPSGAATPTTVAAPTNTTTGGLKQTNPGGGRQKWLVSLSVFSNSPGTFLLYDRLLHIGGLNGTVTTPQTVGGSLTRYNSNSTCVGNQIWVEINTAVGSTARTITASYTNQAGAGATGVATDFGGSGATGIKTSFYPLNLAAGDTGVSAVASVTLSGTTGTAGDFGIVVLRPIAFLAFTQSGAMSNCIDLMTGLPGPFEIQTDACLALAWMSNAGALPRFFGCVHFIES